jgi:hypothetical protein
MQFLGRRPLWVLPLAIAASLAVLVGAATAGSGVTKKATSTAVPASGVYTCDWISSHVVAALRAGVTCDPVIFSTQMSGFMPSTQPVVTSNTRATPLVNGIYGPVPVPANGDRVGQGVFAWGPGEYSNYWNFWANYKFAYSGLWYNWWVEKSSDNSVLISGKGLDTSGQGPITVQSYTTRKWGAQNRTGVAQNWTLYWGCTGC